MTDLPSAAEVRKLHKRVDSFVDPDELNDFAGPFVVANELWIWFHNRGPALADLLEQRETCEKCGHPLSRHDPEDGTCDCYASEGIGVCPCGRERDDIPTTEEVWQGIDKAMERAEQGEKWKCDAADQVRLLRHWAKGPCSAGVANITCDVENAADTIEMQQQRITNLEAALRKLANDPIKYDEKHRTHDENRWRHMQAIARAALGEEVKDG